MNIEQAQKVIQELISEAKYMDGFLKDEVTKKAYREKKERQLSVLNELIEELKNTESDTIFLEVPTVSPTLHTPKLETRCDMSIRKIQGLYGKEAARAESIQRANEFMDYQEEKYGLKSKQ